MSKKVKEISLGSKTSKNIDNRVVRNILGPELFDFGQLENQNSLGQVNGLAWTSVGELLKIEAALTRGKVGLQKQVHWRCYARVDTGRTYCCKKYF